MIGGRLVWRDHRRAAKKRARAIEYARVRPNRVPHYRELIKLTRATLTYADEAAARLCEEVHLNLAYRWFCRLGLDADVPDHSTFSKNRHGRFRESDLFRKLFETVVARCMKEGRRRWRAA